MATGARRQRRKKRKERRLILTIFTFLIVIGAIITSITVFLKVADIEVKGLTKYDKDDVIAISGIKVGDNMFAINKFDVAEKILNEYPYLKTIKIRRKLPDTFIFEITERSPMAYISADGKKWLIDENAYILEMLPADAAPELFEIIGATAIVPETGKQLVLSKSEQLDALKKVLPALKNSGMAKNMKRVEIEKFYEVKMVYEDRFLIEFGDSETFPRKLEMLKAVIAQLDEDDRGTINVSAVKKASFLPNMGIDLLHDNEKTSSPQEETTTEGTELPEGTENNVEGEPAEAETESSVMN